ncbi:MAG: gas vesicle protein GvpH [Thermodesulfobacteriota bacterium]
MAKKSKDEAKSDALGSGLVGFLGGLAELVEKLGEIAETGKQLSREGEISGMGPGKNLRGVYGFNVKVGLGGDKEIKIEPFGNIKRDKRSGQTVVQEVREPLVDIFEEEDHTLIVAEMPGISADDVKLSLRDDVLTISAERRDKKYRKELLLPRVYSKEKMLVSCNNGMLEIKCVN